jgi:hypothetical protein
MAQKLNSNTHHNVFRTVFWTHQKPQNEVAHQASVAPKDTIDLICGLILKISYRPRASHKAAAVIIMIILYYVIILCCSYQTKLSTFLWIFGWVGLPIFLSTIEYFVFKQYLKLFYFNINCF